MFAKKVRNQNNRECRESVERVSTDPRPTLDLARGNKIAKRRTKHMINGSGKNEKARPKGALQRSKSERHKTRES